MLTTLLLGLALICFVLVTFNIPLAGLNLTALGLALWVATLILGELAGVLSQTVIVVLLAILLIALIIHVVVRIPRAKPPT